jgi:hypothetical protein
MEQFRLRRSAGIPSSKSASSFCPFLKHPPRPRSLPGESSAPGPPAACPLWPGVLTPRNRTGVSLAAAASLEFDGRHALLRTSSIRPVSVAPFLGGSDTFPRRRTVT